MTDEHDSIAAEAIRRLPAELQPLAHRWLQRLRDTGDLGDVAISNLGPLVKLVSCSDFAAATLLREWSWFASSQHALNAAPDRTQLQRFADQVATSESPVESVMADLRRFRHRYMVHVLWREFAGSASVEESLRALSDLADGLLSGAARYAERVIRGRHGCVRDADGQPVPLVILGMGKLGGRELNFSSDIDLIFLYPGGEDSDGERSLSPQEYFARLSRQIVALLDEVTADGFVFRMDMRLRPFGESGPPVTSFAALESYLLQHGRGWERYAYVKARIVGQQTSAATAKALYEDLITPFVYRRYLDFGVFESLREMQALIAAEVERREMASNVKLGPGGIREVEFIVQSIQLVRGGSRTELRSRELLEVLPKLVARHGLTRDEAEELAAAYRFLRRVENFVQAMRDQQTHDLPGDNTDRARLFVAMGYPDWASFHKELAAHREHVTRRFGAITLREGHIKDDERAPLETLWDKRAAPDAWGEYFDNIGLSDSDAVAAAIHRFANAPATRQIDNVSSKRLREFIPALIGVISRCEDPGVALPRVLSIVEQILRRSAYIALLNENPQVLARLVHLCSKSIYIAQQIARFPILLDELLDPRLFAARISRDSLEFELRDRLLASGAGNQEEQIDVLGQFQRASMFRIAVADFNGSLPVMRVSDALTDLAEIVLENVLDLVWHDMTEKHGEPQYIIDGVVRTAGLGIIAYGKLGGIELSYGSDLDIVLLHDSRGDGQRTNGERSLDNAMFFPRLVRRLVHFLTAQTGSGALYEVDMRLRPDGRSGLLVSSTEAFEHYQEANAWTWEHQALLRARPVAGSARIAREFQRIRVDTLTSRVRLESLRDDVQSMRGRMRTELDKSDAQVFDLKQGSGGIGDIEFIVQYLVLANAATHRAVIHYPDNIRQLATLAAAGCLPETDALRLQDIYRAYRLRLHHVTLDERRPLVPADEFADERADVERLWRRHLGNLPT